MNSFQHLASLGTFHFKQLYKTPPIASLVEIVRVAQFFPWFVDMEDVVDLNKAVTLGELEATLKLFKKYKTLGPDGWTIEFYIGFFEILGEDLLKVIEDCKISGHMYEAFNSTFIVLIPKSDNPGSFDEFRPISLYNCIYKIIAKIIENCLCPILSSHISSENFSFLQDQ